MNNHNSRNLLCGSYTCPRCNKPVEIYRDVYQYHLYSHNKDNTDECYSCIFLADPTMKIKPFDTYIEYITEYFSTAYKKVEFRLIWKEL